MGASLLDITIYYDEYNTELQRLNFGQTANYIADFYHDRLNGYKPPKTGRICIDLGPEKNYQKPNFFGAICSYDNVIDVQKYAGLSKKEKYSYLLDLLHSTVSEIAGFYHWDQPIFDKAYKHIVDSDFKFEKFYPQKRSPDRKCTGQVILTKTEEKATLSARITHGESFWEGILVEKRNWYWYDPVYKMAKSCKWLDNSSFGLYKGEKNCYFSTDNDEVVSDMVFGEEAINFDANE